MKKIKIGVAIVAATMILAACNDKEKDIEVDVEGTQQEQPQVEEKPVTEPKAEEQEEKVSEDMYKKSNDKERKN